VHKWVNFALTLCFSGYNEALRLFYVKATAVFERRFDRLNFFVGFVNWLCRTIANRFTIIPTPHDRIRKIHTWLFWG